MKRLSVVFMMAFLLMGCGNSLNFDINHKIHVVSREDGSGTRGAFTELTGITTKDDSGVTWDHTTVDAIITNSTSVVLTTVGGDKHAIGYLSLGSMNDSVKGLSVNGIEPTAEEIKAGNYPIARPFLVATTGEQKELTKDFIAFIVSQEGQNIVEDAGYVSFAEGNPYEDHFLTGKIVVGGSSSVTPVMEKLKEAYLAYHPEVVIEVQQSDSTTGMASVMAGNYDIGMSSRALKDSEKNQGLAEQTIALDGIVLIVNDDNPITTVSLSTVDDIFTGEYTMWKELGGDSNG